MFDYIIRRVLYVIPIGLGVTILVFALVHMSPGDPLSAVVPPDAPEEMVQNLKKAYGFDKPLPVQYVTWLGRVLTGDLGVSVARGREVVAELRIAVPNTFILAVGGTLLGFTLGAIFGGIAGYFQGRWIDKVATSFAITGVSVPHYWLGLVLVIIFSVEMNVLPSFGMGPGGSTAWKWDAEHLRHLVLPVVTLAVIPMGLITRTVRATVAEILNQEFVQALHAKGLLAPPGPLARGAQRGSHHPRGDGSSARLPARRLHPGRDGVPVAGHRVAPQQRDLRARPAPAPGDDPRARDVLRAPEPPRRHHAVVDRSADVAPVTTGSAHERAAVDAAQVAVRSRGYWTTVALRVRDDKVTIVCGVVLLAIILSAVFADLVTLADPYKATMLKRLKPIGTPGYPLGADEMGRDMLTRLIYGGRLSLFMGISPIVIALAIGGSLGLVAGFLGGRVNMLIMRVMDVFYAFPSVLLAVAISGALGAGIGNAIVSLTLVFIPPITRMTESVTTQVRSLDYVEAARASGAGSLTIIRVHILTNVLGPVFIYSTSLISVSIILASGLSFLGLGTEPPEPEWGLMLNTLRQSIYVNPWVAALPGAMIFFTSLTFNLLSDGLRSAMDVRL